MILVSVGPTAGALQLPRVAAELAAADHDVEVLLEPGTRHFVGPGSFAAPVRVVERPSMAPEALLFAPATAATLARLAHGLDLKPVGRLPDGVRTFVVPDLDAGTTVHPAVGENLETLRSDGRRVIPGGTERMASVGEVVAGVLGGLGGPLSGMRILVTAGGTHEPIDSVRFIGNRSSGKMGLAVAREASRLGAEVTLVAANVAAVEPGVETVAVETVAGMKNEVLRLAPGADALVMAAAVSDFTPASVAREKIRRSHGIRSLELQPTADVLGAVRGQNPDLLVVGFAATHGDPVPDAREKLSSKGADLIVGNDISREGVGFGAEDNEVYVVGRGGERFVPRATKALVAREILDSLMALMGGERRS